MRLRNLVAKSFQHRPRLIDGDDPAAQSAPSRQRQGKPAIATAKIGKDWANEAKVVGGAPDGIAPLSDYCIGELAAIGKSFDIIGFSVNTFATQ